MVLAQLAIAATLDAQLLMRARETAGVARANEVIRSGVPLPRALGVTNTARLAIADANGAAVPAQFRILARWNAGLADASAPIQWLLVSFPASVAANATATYRLVTDGSLANPAPAVPLRVTTTNDRITVDTGAAVFTIGAARLFDDVRVNGATLIGGGTLTARINDTDASFAATRRIVVEESGPLAASVIVDGTYDFPSTGSHRRYVFRAGSGTAIVEQTLTWEGDLCRSAGAIECNGQPNAVRVRRVRDTLATQLAPPLQVTATGARTSGALTSTIAPGQTASVRQTLRANRTAPPAYAIALPNGTTSGRQADGATLALQGANGTIAIAIDHMHRYEPQALRLLDDGTLAIDLADDQAWLSSRQGLFATFAVGVTPGDVWALLNHPLRAWPDASWWAKSDAVPEVAPATLPSSLAGYDNAMQTVLDKTVSATDRLGVFGLMTFGAFPRLWGNPIYSDEIDCDDDPTPSESWDDLYWCTTWTDYHNAAANAALWTMRSGNVKWLDEIARPAALRMLHTQIQQCSPDDPYFYCGQSPAGYGGYREDFNSSHAYFENLFLHYWLTGDSTVADTLQRGSRTMREYLCTRRPASACEPHDAPQDEFANLTGRVASQWFSTFRFVGLASSDATYLDDYRANLARAVTQQYVAADRNGTRYGFLLGDWNPVLSAGTKTTDQLWMTAFYDMNNLDRLQRDTGDAPIGDPPLRPSEILLSLVRTLQTFGATVAPGGNGGAGGAWPNQMDFTWTGPRVAGTLVSVRATPGGGDPLLYDSGKGTLTAAVARAAVQSGDPRLLALANDLAAMTISNSLANGSPLASELLEFLTRLHAAVGVLGAVPPSKHRAAKH